MTINNYKISDNINKLSAKSKKNLIDLIENNLLDTCTRLITNSKNEEEIAQISVLTEFSEIDLNFENLENYLQNEGLKRGDLTRL